MDNPLLPPDNPEEALDPIHSDKSEAFDDSGESSAERAESALEPSLMIDESLSEAEIVPQESRLGHAFPASDSPLADSHPLDAQEELPPDELARYASPRPFKPEWSTLAVWALLIAVLGSGFWLRSVGRNWDDYTHLHPDERFLTGVASRIDNDYGGPLEFTDQRKKSAQEQAAHCLEAYPPPSEDDLAKMSDQEALDALDATGKGGYFDALCSSLNPNNQNSGLYVYGEFPMFSLRTLGESLANLKQESVWLEYNGIHIVGRGMNAVFDTLSILLIFLIGQRLFGSWRGLLAASFYAFAAFPIQQSHFWTVDAFTSFWVVLAIYFAVRVMDDASEFPRRYVFLPWVGFGLAGGIWDMLSGARGFSLGIVFDGPNEVSAWTLIAYLTSFLVIGISAHWAYESRQQLLAGWGFGLGIVVLVVASLLGIPIDLYPAFSSLAVAVLFVLGWLLGGRFAFAYSGLWEWFAAAFAVWVFDSMAHTTDIRFTSLWFFLILFTLAGLATSTIRNAYQRRGDPLTALLFGTLTLLWAIIGLTSGEVTGWGMITALLVAFYLGALGIVGLSDYAGFGLAFGAAMAGRVNTLPVVGVLFLAIILRGLPVMYSRAVDERQNIFWRVLGGLVVAGFASLFAFRILQPHAFVGPTFFGVFEFNSGWQEDIAEAQRLVSREADFPPAHQWTNRVRWLFPGQNIVLYGLGIALGVAAVIGFGWSLIRIGRGKANWTRLALPAIWVLVYFGWLGQNWVATMRYFLPIYGMLTLMAAWALSEWVLMAWRRWKHFPSQESRLLVGISTLPLIFVLAYTILYGYGFTSIYRHELTRVQATRFYQEKVPADFGLWVETDKGTRLHNIALFPNDNQPRIIRLEEGQSQSFDINPFGVAQVEGIEIYALGDPNQDPGEEAIRFILWAEDAGFGRQPLGTTVFNRDLSASEHVSGGVYTIPLTSEVLQPLDGRRFLIEMTVIDGPITLASHVNERGVIFQEHHLSVVFSTENTEVPLREDIVLPVQETDVELLYYTADNPVEYRFRPFYDGEIVAVEIPHVADPFGDADSDELEISLIYDREFQAAMERFQSEQQRSPTPEEVQEMRDEHFIIVTGKVAGDFNPFSDGPSPFGPSVRVEFDTPFTITANTEYKLLIKTQQLLGITGTIVASEVPWDDPIPYKVCYLPDGYVYQQDENPSGLCTAQAFGPDPYSGYYTGLNMPMSDEDDAKKRDRMLAILNQVDYLNISSNRFYDSYARIPMRWPMGRRYYSALFSGELGFELVDTFESYAQVGPIVWRDQVLPTDNLPEWRNEFEAEEAFHVYDHPVVFVFRKTAEYTPEKAATILDGNLRRFNETGGLNPFDTEPAAILTWSGGDSASSPLALQLTDSAREKQQASGTWSDLFHRNALHNKYQVVGVAVWWLALVLMGWLSFPFLFAMFPALPDRGYGFGKLLGWVLVAWVAWFGGSLNLPLWSTIGLWGILAVYALLSATLAYRQRQRLWAFVQDKGQHLVAVETLSLILFLYFIGVRLGNPDLWHQSFGGEKPMNFAYFNSVLRSSVFPPSDPWFAGGFINYYYWGYVLVGAPVKALGFVPSFAYNLILPTIFMWTGIGGFTLAYNLVAWRNERATYEIDEKRPFPDRKQPATNPYLAGILVLVLMIILGNLDTPRTFGKAVAQSGGWRGVEGLVEDEYSAALNEFEQANSRPPDEEERAEIIDELRPSTWDEWQAWWESFKEGLNNVFEGNPLPLASHRWYWGPRSIITELPNDVGHHAIVEMPYFTFLYGDLHAHMISMPVTLLALLFIIGEVMGAGLGLRQRWASALSLFTLALIVGLLKAINTWDWPIYMIVGITGLTFATWVGQKRVSHSTPVYRLFQGWQQPLDLGYWGEMIGNWWRSPLWQRLQAGAILLPAMVGLIVGFGLHKVHTVRYEAKLDNGEIFQHCIQYDNLLDNPDIDHAVLNEPTNCDGMLKPRFTPQRIGFWLAFPYAAMVGLYVVGFVLLGAHFDKKALVAWVGRLLAFGVISVFVIVPYENSFASPYSKVLPWELEKTPLWAYLTIHGTFLVILYSFVLWQTVRWLRQHKVADLRGYGVPFLLVVMMIPLCLGAVIYFGFFSDLHVFAIAFPLFVWLAVLFLLPHQSNTERLVYAAAGLAIALTMGVEMYVLDGDNGRQNTVFKFYIQAWLLFSLAGGIGLAWMLSAADRWHFALRGIWQTGVVLVMSVALLYPIMATQARFLDRMAREDTPLTLDGTAYMEYAPHNEEGIPFNLNGDYHMIRWLQDNVEGTPYIIEATTHQYRWGSRITINTGLPTVLGWNFHQRQQRNISILNNMVWNRHNNVDAFYYTPDIEAAWNILQTYEVEYIIVGSLERIYYQDIERLPEGGIRINTSPGITKFEQMVEMGLLTAPYRQAVCISNQFLTAEDCPPEYLSEDIIYQVVPSAQLPDNLTAVQTDNATALTLE